MEFNSFSFIVFFPIVSIIFFVLPHSLRWIWLLAASCYFYVQVSVSALLLLLAVTAVLFCTGILIEKYRERNNQRTARIYLVIGITLPVIMLFICKYLNFFNSNIAAIAKALHLQYPVPILKILIPLGISYYVFQVISYIVDIYRGSIQAEHHPGIFTLCIMFFPKIIAGPIERPASLLKQLHEKQNLDFGRISDGLILMAWGFFKKLVIADRLAIPVNDIFNNVVRYDWSHYLVAAFFFTLQLYADFSGYTDIALGSSRVLGFRLADNFRKPYFSISISDFWGGWHISLSSWLRDYVYIPLGGNRGSKPRVYFNIFITFLISGIWHGANWTFITWGILHGMYIIIGMITKPVRDTITRLTRIVRFQSLHRALQMTITFILVMFAWIFFRANSINDAGRMIGGILNGLFSSVRSLLFHDFTGIQFFSKIMIRKTNAITIFGFNSKQYLIEMTILFISLGLLAMTEIIQREDDFIAMISKKRTIFRWSFYLIILLSILLFGMYSNTQFIYFNF